MSRIPRTPLNNPDEVVFVGTLRFSRGIFSKAIYNSSVLVIAAKFKIGNNGIAFLQGDRVVSSHFENV